MRGRGETARVRGRWEREWCVRKMEGELVCGKDKTEGRGDKKMGREICFRKDGKESCVGMGGGGELERGLG